MAENLEKRRGEATVASDIVEDRKMHCGVREARNITIETHTNGKLIVTSVMNLQSILEVAENIPSTLWHQ